MTFKAKVLIALIKKLESEMQVALRSAEEAHVAATHEESAAEDKYDTRGLEASYLAGGQKRRATELELIIEGLKSLRVKEFTSSDAIQLTALVEVNLNDKRMLFFISNKGGGTSLVVEGKNVQVVTPESRLGKELLGKRVGEVVEVKIPNNSMEYEILSTS